MIKLSDATLRDARHAPGVYFTVEEAISVARLLDGLGVSEIEAGLADPAGSDGDYLAAIAASGLAATTSSLFFCLSRQSIAERISFVVDHGCESVCISIPTSEQFIQAKLNRSFRATCKLLESAVTAAVDAGLNVAFSGEDAARADIQQLIQYVRVGADAGAHRFRFAESVACLEPNAMRQRISALTADIDIDVEVHCHSAYGLAVANSVAGIEAGAAWVSTTVGGIGERGGNTPLAPLLLYLYKFAGQTDLEPAGLTELERYVASVTRLPQHRFASITGDDAFCYELDSQYRVPDMYEDYPPELVGNERFLVLGRKGEAGTVEQWSAELGVDAADLRDLGRATVETERRPLRLGEARELLGRT